MILIENPMLFYLQKIPCQKDKTDAEQCPDTERVDSEKSWLVGKCKGRSLSLSKRKLFNVWSARLSTTLTLFWRIMDFSAPGNW